MKKILFSILISSNLCSQGFTSFTSFGTESQYVPVVFQTTITGVGTSGNRTINISRNNVHENNTWRGHGIITITSIGHSWGSGGNSIRLDNFTFGRETPSNATSSISLVGRVVCDFSQNNIIVFLRGGEQHIIRTEP